MFDFIFRSPFKRHSGEIAAIAVSPDGTKAVSGAHRSQFLDREGVVWDLPSGRVNHRLRGHEVGIFSAAFSPTGNLIATGGGGAVKGRHWIHDNAIRLWDANGRAIRKFGEDLFFVYALAFSHDGKFLISGSGNHTKKAPVSDGSCLRLWDVGSGQEIRRFGHHGSAANAIALSPDGDHIVAGSHGMQADGSIAGGSTVRTRIRRRDEPAVPGETLMAKEQLIHYINTQSLNKQTAQILEMLAGRLNSDQLVAISIAQHEFSSEVEQQTIRAWKMNSGEEIGLFSHQGWVNSVSFSPDGKHLLSAGKGVILWNAASCEQIGQIGGKEVSFTHCAAFSPNGRFVATGTGFRVEMGAPFEDCFVRLYESESGQESAKWDHKYPVKALAFTPDGRHILAAGEHGEMHLWPVPS